MTGSPRERAEASAALIVAAAAVRTAEAELDKCRDWLRARMVDARKAGVTDVGIANAAGVTKGRVGQLLGPKRQAKG